MMRILFELVQIEDHYLTPCIASLADADRSAGESIRPAARPISLMQSLNLKLCGSKQIRLFKLSGSLVLFSPSPPISL